MPKAKATGALHGAALAVALAMGAAAPVWAQSAADDPDAPTSADVEALHEYNQFAAAQAARAGVAMFKAGYTKYSITQLEKAVRLAPKNATYRKALAEAQARLAQEERQARRPAHPLASGGDEDTGIQVPGFVPPSTVAGSQSSEPAPDTGSDGAASDDATPARPGTADGTSADKASASAAADDAKGATGAMSGVSTGVVRAPTEPPLTGAAHFDVPFGTVPGGPPLARPRNDLAIRPVEEPTLNLPAARPKPNPPANPNAAADR